MKKGKLDLIGSSKDIEKAFNCDLFKTVEASSVTLKRIDNITKAFTDDAWRQGWIEDIGKKQVILDGGEALKDCFTLKFSAKVKSEQNKKIILLTYNHALVTELKRLSQYLEIIRIYSS